MTKKSKILAVDDEAFNLDIMVHFLEREGHVVISATNGREGLLRIEEHKDIDVIVLDRMMPDLDGLEVLKRIKASPELNHIPVVMQTAAVSSEQVWDGISAGAYYYLTKPYNGKTLVSVVDTALRDKERIQKERGSVNKLESEELFRNLADHMSQMTWMADEKGQIFWFSQGWAEYAGISPEALAGGDWQKVHHRDYAEKFIENIQYCFDMKESLEDTTLLRGKDGEYRWFLTRVTPVKDQKGQVQGWFGTDTDFSGMKPYSPGDSPPKFTVREKEILSWQAKGKTRWEIATILNISEDTVKEHIERAHQKLGAKNTAQAIARALICGIIFS